MSKTKATRRPPGGRKKKGQLTAKQRRFVDEYLVDSNATRAALAAGFTKKNAGSLGIQLLKKTHVAKAVAAGQEKLAVKTGLTAERVREMMVEDRQKAIALKQMPAAVRSTENLGRSLPGFFVERREHGGVGGGAIPVAVAAVSAEELEKRLSLEQAKQALKLSEAIYNDEPDPTPR